MYKKGLLLAIQIASHLAYMVLLPLFILGGAGIYADQEFNSSPRFLLVGIVMAFAITIVWIKRQLLPIITAIQQGK